MDVKEKLIFIFIAFFVIVIDQGTKIIVRSRLAIGKNIPILGNVFSIEHIQNPGALFGMFPSSTRFFIVLSVFVTALIIFFIFRSPFSSFQLFTFGLIVGGIVGNLIDRIVFGYVTDFLYITHWPIFNFADSAIDIGLVLFVYYVLKNGKYF
jgi:signal peptidase II